MSSPSSSPSISSDFVPEKSSSRAVTKAVAYAITKGYEVAPNAVKLLQRIPNKIGDLTPESVIGLVIEEKVRSTIGKSTHQLVNTITEKDLLEILPDLFESFSPVKTEELLSKERQLASNLQSYDDVEKSIEIVSDPSSNIKPVGVEGFSELFKSRYEKLLRILRERPESRQLVKSTGIISTEKKVVARLAGLVYSKRGMKNGVELVLDDDVGKVSVFALTDEAKKAVSEVVLDQCVMVEIEGREGRFVLKSLTQPDIPKRVASFSKKTAYVIFLSDLHIGSNKFLEGAFSRFLEWLSGKGLQQEIDEEIIRHLKYIIIGGDVVDGVGIFPNQEYELAENDVFKQYEMVSKKLAVIPKHLQMLVIPGNHDSTRQALPQPMIPIKYASSLYDLPNVTMLGDPSLIKLYGVSILVYHGRSLDDILATTPGLSYEEPTRAMKVLLKARHLAPIFGSRTPIAPELEDYLVIEQVPDIFHSGHVHTVGFEFYKSTLMINSGTWQAQTGYQKNLGIMPKPGLVPIVNLATLEVQFREFLTTYEK